MISSKETRARRDSSGSFGVEADDRVGVAVPGVRAGADGQAVLLADGGGAVQHGGELGARYAHVVDERGAGDLLQCGQRQPPCRPAASRTRRRPRPAPPGWRPPPRTARRRRPGRPPGPGCRRRRAAGPRSRLGQAHVRHVVDGPQRGPVHQFQQRRGVAAFHDPADRVARRPPWRGTRRPARAAAAAWGAARAWPARRRPGCPRSRRRAGSGRSRRRPWRCGGRWTSAARRRGRRPGRARTRRSRRTSRSTGRRSRCRCCRRSCTVPSWRGPAGSTGPVRRRRGTTPR